MPHSSPAGPYTASGSSPLKAPSPVLPPRRPTLRSKSESGSTPKTQRTPVTSWAELERQHARAMSARNTTSHGRQNRLDKSEHLGFRFFISRIVVLELIARPYQTPERLTSRYSFVNCENKLNPVLQIFYINSKPDSGQARIYDIVFVDLISGYR